MNKKILVIDDEELMRLMLIELFKSHNIDAVGASNGVEGLDILSREEFDIVLTDLVMPEKEGVETIKDIRKLYPDLYIIAMSGGGRLNGVEYLELAAALGANKTIQKPFERHEFMSEIQNVLENL